MITSRPFAHLLAVAALACGVAAGPAVAAGTPFTALYVFGDSLSDGGNNRLVLGNGGAGQVITGNSYIPTFPYASGVYSNGPVWVNTFAAGLGLPAFAAPSLLGGGDYAYGGARTSTEGSIGGFPPSLKTQLNGFLGSGIGVSASALYVIAGGGNDVRDVADALAGGADPNTLIPAAALAYATTTATMVGQLKAAGAQNIVVWNAPNLGLTPAALAAGPAAAGAASFISTAFNQALGAALTGSGVTLFDVFGLVTSISLNPAGYGFTNVTDACGAAINACNPTTALFWDGIHPTAAAHVMLGNAMLAAVPEPQTAWMLFAGLLTLAAWRRRR